MDISAPLISPAAFETLKQLFAGKERKIEL
jgi:hypothetical protein